MADLQGIDTTDAKDLFEGFPPMPPGDYTVYMEKSDWKDTKSGKMLLCEFVVKGGEFDGRKVFHNLNLINSSQQAVDIAKSEWRAICEAAIGLPNAPNNDSASLHFKPFIAAIDVETYKKDAGTPNEKEIAKNILVMKKGKIRKADGSAPQAATSGPSPSAAATGGKATATATRPPWAK